MPRYYFHIFNDLNAHDTEGQDFTDVEAAREKAIKECRVLAAESVREGHLNLTHHIEMCDADGRQVSIVTFADAVRILGR